MASTHHLVAYMLILCSGCTYPLVEPSVIL